MSQRYEMERCPKGFLRWNWIACSASGSVAPSRWVTRSPKESSANEGASGPALRCALSMALGERSGDASRLGEERGDPLVPTSSVASREAERPGRRPHLHCGGA